MASTNKTANLGLSQWEASDAFTREDLNADFRKIDGAAAYLPVKLADLTIEAQTQSITIDLSDKNTDQFEEVIIYANFEEMKSLRVNGVETKSYGAASASSYSEQPCMPLYPGRSRMSVTRACFVYHTDGSHVIYTMQRTNFPSLNTLVIYANEAKFFSVGDRISVWGVRR